MRAFGRGVLLLLQQPDLGQDDGLFIGRNETIPSQPVFQSLDVGRKVLNPSDGWWYGSHGEWRSSFKGSTKIAMHRMPFHCNGIRGFVQQ